MARAMAVPLWMLILIMSFYATQQVVVCQRIIHINSTTGEDSPDCLRNSSFPCRNLTWVFQQPRSDSTHYVLSEGQHFLTQATPPFQDLTSLAITGAGSVVTCTESETGLAFIGVKNITLHDVSFYNCSSLRNSTSRKYDYSKNNSEFDLYQFHVALYFYKCSDITMTSLVVSDSPNATAVVVYNTIGTNVVEHSSFTSNRLGDPRSAEHPGGGGFYVEFTFCIPGDTSCDNFDDSIADSNSNGEFHFHNVTFRRNKASNLLTDQESDTHIIPYGRIHNAFGKGGGLAIVVKGNASNNSFDITECMFELNEATWGSGLLIEYQDHSSSNTIAIRDSTFRNNGLQESMETTGGGIRVGHYVYNLLAYPASTRNRVMVSGCEIYGNHALNGGGISVFPVRQLVTATNQVFEITICNTTFTRNQAQVGAALETTLFSLFIKGQLPSVAISSAKFIANSIRDQTDEPSIPHEVGVGAVYSNGVPIHFCNDVMFERNIGSGLAIVGTLANFSNSNASFTANRGKYGGAISILGAAFLVVNTFTSMMFERNEAEVHGGAIANVFIERENFRSYPNCFVHHDIPFKQPRQWGATFKFVDNFASFLGSSIYTTSLHPCAWAGGSGQSMRDEILCWPGWEFSRDGSRAQCRDEINTESGQISFKHTQNWWGADDSMPTLEVYPGQEFKLPLLIKDDLGKLVENETVFSAKSLQPDVSRVNPRYRFLSGEDIQVDGVENNSITLQLNSNNGRPWEIGIGIKLLDCRPGYVLYSHEPPDNTSSTCQCSPDNYQGLLHCGLSDKVYITNGYWFGRTNDTANREFVASLCLPGFCDTATDDSKKEIPISDEDLNDELCGPNNRTGILCGRCKDGFGTSVNTENFECILCDDKSIMKDVVLYILSVYLPLFVLFVFIIIFNVRLASGPANALIFYAQFVSSTFDLNADSHIPIYLITKHYKKLLQVYRVPYGLFNLDFLENFIGPLCFGTGLGTLDVLQLEYLIALFPLLMIIGIVVMVRIKDSHFFSCCRRCCKKPSWKFLRHWRANESLLHAFSAFLLLSYTKFSLTSSYLVNVHPFFNAKGETVGDTRAYYDGEYKSSDRRYILQYRLPACLVLVVIAVLPLVLFGYPIIWFEKCIIKRKFLWRWYPADKVQIFLDTFQGCYKDNRRYFAGMYFAFRLTINVSYIVINSWLEQFVCQQVACTIFIFIIALCWPYREEKWYLNYVDLFIFSNLATVNAFSLYLFVYAKINHSQSLPHWPFIVQYILVFLPLIYMVLYLIWYFLPPAQKEILVKVPKIPANLLKKRRKRKYLRTTLLGSSEGPSFQRTRSKTSTGVENEPTTTEITLLSDTEVETDDDEAIGGSDDDLEAILARAQTGNTYRNKSSLTTPYQQWVQSAKEAARLSSSSRVRAHGQFHTAPVASKDRRNDLSSSVHETVTSSGDKRESGIQSCSTVNVTELSRRHSLGSYGSIDSNNQAEL